jgi:hypothetical protein
VLDERVALLEKRIEDLKGKSPVDSKAESDDDLESEQDFSVAIEKESPLPIKANCAKSDTSAKH